jgi:hypothetical protein
LRSVSSVTWLISCLFAKKNGGNHEFSLIGTVVVTVTRSVASLMMSGVIFTVKFLTVAAFRSLSATVFPSAAVEPGGTIARAVS